MASDTHYFPTEDPNWYIACDFNPQDGQYNLNRRRDSLPMPVAPRRHASVTCQAQSERWTIGRGHDEKSLTRGERRNRSPIRWPEIAPRGGLRAPCTPGDGNRAIRGPS